MSENNLSNQELNVWLYEHLFGAKWYTSTPERLEKCQHLKGLRWLYTDEEAELMVRQKTICLAAGDETPDELECVPIFSESIDLAWTVIDALRARGWLAVVKDMPDGFPYLDDNDNTLANQIFRRACADFRWMPRKDSEDTRKTIHSHCLSVADTPARAICEAAKKAVEADNLYANQKSI